MKGANQPQRSDTREVDAVNVSKRRFLGGAAAAAGLTLAPGILLYQVGAAQAAKGGRGADEPASSAVRWGMLIDVSSCQDCDLCVQACNKENGLVGHGRPKTDAQWIRKVALQDKKTGFAQELPLLCQHCEHPPCVDVCPTSASFKRADGIVLVDKHRCIGCRYCMMACPYKARSFVHEELENQKVYMPRGKGTVESCTFCVHRVDGNQHPVPACVEACTKENDSMVFGDLNDPESKISQRLQKYGGLQLRADLGLNLGVRYQGLA